SRLTVPLPKDALPIVFLPDWEHYRRAFQQKISATQGVAAAFALDSATVTYFRRREYESTLARRRAILEASAEQLLVRSANLELRAWLRLGLAARLADVGSGSGELPLWRQDLGARAQALAAAGEEPPTLAALLKAGASEPAAAPAGSDAERLAYY